MQPVERGDHGYARRCGPQVRFPQKCGDAYFKRATEMPRKEKNTSGKLGDRRPESDAPDAIIAKQDNAQYYVGCYLDQSGLAERRVLRDSIENLRRR